MNIPKRTYSFKADEEEYSRFLYAISMRNGGIIRKGDISEAICHLIRTYIVEVRMEYKFSSESQDQFFRMVKEVKETVEQSINDWKIKKKKLVEDLAVKVAALPDVEKSRVAGYIAWGFFRQKVPIARRYVYKVLSKEYKNENYSNAAQLTQKLKAQAGTYGKTTVNGTNYVYRDIDIYKPVSLRRLAKDLHKRVEELKAVKDSDQVLTLKQENEALKKQVASLRQQKQGLEQIIAGLKEENAVLRGGEIVELQH
jgi:hypothetical protein